MRNPRRFRAGLIVLLVLANLYGLAVLGAVVSSRATTAHVTRCVHNTRSHTCYGTWPDGGGSISGAGYTDVGHDIPIKIGYFPIGAYTGGDLTPLLQLIVPVFLDLATGLGTFVWFRTRRRLTAPAAAVAQRHGQVLTLRVAGDRAVRPDGAVYLSPGPVFGQYVTSGGTPVFRLDRTDVGYGEPRAVVLGPDNAPLGELVRTHPGIGWLEFAAVINGQPALRATARASSMLPLTGPDGGRLGEIGIQDPDVVLLNLDVPLPEPVHTLLMALVLDIIRLASTRPHIGGASQYYPG